MTRHVVPPATVPLEQARRFLAKAVPWPQNDEGYINLTWSELKPRTEKPIWSGRACRTLDEALGALTWITKKQGKREIYVCMSSQRLAQEKISRNGYKYLAPIRNQRNVVALKSLYVDIDFKGGEHGHDTPSDAIKALAQLIKATGLPRPSIIVKSGGGLHIHFTLSRALTRAEWQPLAHALAEAGKRHGLKADYQVTTDSARLLRIPGTENNKQDTPRPVTLAGNPLEFDYDPDHLWKALEPYKISAPLRGKPMLDPILFPQRPPIAGISELSAGIDKREYSPVHLDDLAKECAFISEAIATGGQKYSNPMWNLTTLIATFTDDARYDAHRMGDKHQGYSEESTDDLLDRKFRQRDEKGLGFPRCVTISGSGCTACQSCPHFTKGRSPLVALPRKVTSSTTSSSLGGISRSDPLCFYKLPVAEVVQRINQEFFVLRSSGKIYREGEDGELNALPKSDFSTAMGGRRAEYSGNNDDSKTRPAASAWHDSPQRREYTGLEYCPDNRGARTNYKNLWRGWGIVPVVGDCAIVLNHIHDIVADGNDPKADFLLDWFADILQNPTRKPGVALIFRGPQGSGKSLLVEIYRRLLGRPNVLITPDKDRILGRFNSALINKILLVGEEMLFAGDRSTTDKLKHLITGQTIPVEFKFGDVLEVTSCHRLILTSNHVQVIQASGEERRFVTYDVSDAKRGVASYFDKLYAIADGRDDATAAAFMAHLLRRDLSGFKPWKAQQDFGGDAALKKQKLLSLAPPLAWLREIIDTADGQGLVGCYDWIDGLPFPKAVQTRPRRCKWPPQFSRREAIDAFRAWSTKSKPYGVSEFTGSAERFWAEIHKVIPRSQTNRQTSGGIRIVSIDLADLQSNFEKYLRGDQV